MKKEKFACEKCGSNFSSKKNLEVHVETIHEGKKPFACSLCEKQFATKSNLKQHLLKHSSNFDEGKNFKRLPLEVGHFGIKQEVS